MTSQNVTEVGVGVLIPGLLVYRQVRSRPVRGDQRILLILLLLGLIGARGCFEGGKHGVSASAVALTGSLVLAAAFGAVRAFTVRIWTQDGQPWARGSLRTAVLWVLALAAHLGYDYLVGRHRDIGDIGGATVVLYPAATLRAQRVVMTYRARRLAPVGIGGG